MFTTAEDIIKEQLSADETLLWSGRPKQGLVFRPSDIFMIPFTLLWGGFAVIWEVGVISAGAPWWFALFGVPFVVIGIYIMFGRFWVDARQRHAMYYGVTPERVIIVSGLFARQVKSISLKSLANFSLIERRNGAGIITFWSAVHPYFWSSAMWPGMGYQSVPTFELAADARSVYNLIRDAQRKAK